MSPHYLVTIYKSGTGHYRAVWTIPGTDPIRLRTVTFKKIGIRSKVARHAWATTKHKQLLEQRPAAPHNAVSK